MKNRIMYVLFFLLLIGIVYSQDSFAYSAINLNNSILSMVGLLSGRVKKESYSKPSLKDLKCTFSDRKVIFTAHFDKSTNLNMIKKHLKVKDSNDRELILDYKIDKVENTLVFEIKNFDFGKRYYLVIEKDLKNIFDYRLSLDYIHVIDYSSAFSSIDKYARNVPESETTSILKLANYLSKGAKNDIEKARLIYIWITDNIAYDVESLYKRRSSVKNLAKSVLKSRKSVCNGYSVLFKALADEMGLKSFKVIGSAKGSGYEIGDKIKASNHAWNAVIIDGKEYLLDVTWGAGHTNFRKFIKKFKNYYFLTPPEEFIYDHFPDDSDWQLLKTKITLDEYAKLPTASIFFEYGIRLITPKENMIKSNSYTEIELEIPNNVDIQTELTSIVNSGECIVNRTGNNTLVKLKFKYNGSYYLTIYAKKDGDSPSYTSILKYKINVEGAKKPENFKPKTSKKFDEVEGKIIKPSEYFISADNKKEFEFKIPLARKVAAIINGEWFYFEKRETDIFSNEISVKKGEEVQIYANFDKSNAFKPITEYFVFE